MFSIDQNCHSLWDVIPKLQSLSRRGERIHHFIEDIDTAFTSIGSGVGDPSLRIARERFYRSGGADWGAAMFYSEFLGRLPVDIRRWEAHTGMSTSALAHRLGRSVDELYDEFSPSDNWQLIGASYLGDRRYHRVVGDLSVAETADTLRQMLTRARENCLMSFPQADSQEQLREWFTREEKLVERLLRQCAEGKLVDLYRRWLGEYLDADRVTLDVTSSLFAIGADSAQARLMKAFCSNYDHLAGLYNEAIAETSLDLRPLDTPSGELPFFATLEHDRHMVRTSVHLQGGQIRIADRRFDLLSGGRMPADALISGGIRCLAGKAILLVIQGRIKPDGDVLAVPYRGSLYMPAAHRLAEKLTAAGVLQNDELHPVLRVRFGLLDRLKDIQTVIRLPDHLRAYFSRSEIPACELGANYASLAREATGRLEAFKDENARRRWCTETFPDITRTIEQLDTRRRELAKQDAKSQEIRDLSRQQKQLQVKLLDELLRRITGDTQLAEIEYWDSRGAIMPWCIALGGEELYNDVIANARTYIEMNE
ncbi:MAG: hypothetical protein ACYSTL_01780 [Planctomycetota bacterium]|jgi:hypothetical protein